MADLKKYKIDIHKLPLGIHEFRFDFDTDLFTPFENSPITNGKGRIIVNLEKKPNFLNLVFQIHGTVELTCDRSLDLFDYQVDIERGLILKFGQESEEETASDDIEFIPWGIQRINIGQYAYEFLILEIPMKKLHPRFLKDEEDTEEDIDELVYSSDESSANMESANPDPRWEKLKDLKNEKKSGQGSGK